jgi:hypothetical protein
MSASPWKPNGALPGVFGHRPLPPEMRSDMGKGRQIVAVVSAACSAKLMDVNETSLAVGHAEANFVTQVASEIAFPPSDRS